MKVEKSIRCSNLCSFGWNCSLNPHMYQHAGALATQAEHLNILEFRLPPLEE